MCNHANTKKVNDVRVCLNCGLTIMPDGRIFFDRRLPNCRRKRKGKNNGKK